MRARAALLGVMLLLAGAAVHGQDAPVLEDWAEAPAAKVPERWSAYGKEATLTFAPALVVDGGHKALHLKTERYSIRLARKVEIDFRRWPTLTWEWKAVRLPASGDLRSQVNDQVARVVLIFPPRYKPRMLVYVWDTKAPVGTETRTTQMMLDRWLVVVRSGPADVGKWVRETRNVERDFTRLFGGAPPALMAVGVESHSEDAAHASEVLVGAISAGR
jgi:hypothetical protein